MISAGMATKRDLDEFYSVQDVYDMLEIMAVDGHNRKIMAAKS